MSGGLHIYFKYDSSDPETAYLIENFLRTATQYRGKGLDIRAEGGLVVAPGSIIDGKEYTIISNTLHISEMPRNLIDWLLEPYEKSTETTEATVPIVKKNKDY